MIGRLSGIARERGADWVVVDVGGVGYEVHCSARTMQDLPASGEPVSLAIETHVRDDAIRLFGFAGSAEREWFRLLQTVQGVGARVALAVLGALKPPDLASAVALKDRAALMRAPGVGKRVADRIVAELQDRAPEYAGLDATTARLQAELADGGVPGATADAVSALVNLGYQRSEAGAAVAAAARDLGDDAVVGDLIRAGLKELGQ